jgi:hypothetical protein
MPYLVHVEKRARATWDVTGDDRCPVGHSRIARALPDRVRFGSVTGAGTGPRTSPYEDRHTRWTRS